VNGNEDKHKKPLYIYVCPRTSMKEVGCVCVCFFDCFDG
jgi:hypothetical protein